MSSLHSGLSRLMFAGAFALIALAVFEAIVNFFDYTILRGAYTPGRLLEFSVVLMVFVMALLLRQVRDELRGARRQ